MLFATTATTPKTKNHNINMNRSSSFVNAFKFWPLQGQNNHSQSNTTNSGGGGGGVAGGGGSGIAALLPPHIISGNKNSTFGSSVAVQKLRESKWFKRDEQRIFCAVVECGFIVEIRSSNVQQPHRSNSYEQEEDDDEDEIEAQDENVTPVTSWFGIVLCKTAKDNKPKVETIEIFSVKIRDNGTFKMIKMSLEDIWSHGWELRINNFADKEKQAHNEKDIRNQVSFARKAKQSLWNNNKHFVYWCRYGHRQQDVRKRQMSECVKWNSIGMNAGMLLVMNKQKSFSK